MTSCTPSKLIVKTEKGTYTLPHEDFISNRCEAEDRCMQLGAILAPFTEKKEFDKVFSALDSCEHAKVSSFYPRHIGLNIAKDDSSRIFSDGTYFDYSKHGSLYEENYVDMREHCPYAFLDPMISEKLQINANIYCRDGDELYACFKPNKSFKSDAISSEATKVDLNSVVAGVSILFVAAACLVFLLMFKKVKKLSEKNKSLQQKLDLNLNEVQI